MLAAAASVARSGRWPLRVPAEGTRPTVTQTLGTPRLANSASRPRTAEQSANSRAAPRAHQS